MVEVDRFGLVGTLVADKYFVERVVGEGGFGVVYRAMHRIWDEPVAVKCFTALSNAPVEMRDQLLEAFVQEGKLLTALSSRTTGIVQARDIGTLTTPGGVWLPYLVLEWLEGRPLDKWVGHVQGVPVGPPRSALETFLLMDGASRALALAHSRGVAHRDIKPANFFVCSDDLEPGVVIKVLDFGIAKVMQTQAGTAMQATGTQISSFTPSYGAPEQFDRSYGATGPWTDVYQMALVLVEIMRGGAPALEGDAFIQLAFATQNPERRPSPRTLGVDVSDAVEATFQRALALKVVDRFTNMAEFWNALAGALELRDYPMLPIGEAAAGRGTMTDGSLSGGRGPRASELLVSTPVTAPIPGPAGRTEVAGRPRTVVPLEGKRARRPRPAWTLPAIFGGLAAVVAGGVVFAMSGGPAGPDPKPPEPAPIVATKDEPKQVETPPPPKSRCPEGMAHIEGGKFFMGSDADVPVLRMARPAHKVEVRPYCIDLYEVTTEDYEKCSDTGECKRAFRESFWPQGSMKKADWIKARAAYSPLCNAGKGDRKRHPINCVTWAQADAYCRQHGKRLPTEAEFEYAARGSDGRVYPWGDAPPSPKRLNACGSECLTWREQVGLPAIKPMYEDDDSFSGTSPVGSFPEGKTEAGLFDIVGNVFEWNADSFQPYPAVDGTQAEAPATNNRVIRGGAFNSFEPEHTDPALRLPYDAGAYTHGIGFRCAADPR